MRSTTSSALLLSTDCILPTTACYLPATYYLLLLLTTDCVLLTTGFPSNMGENGVKMTLAVFGEVRQIRPRLLRPRRLRPRRLRPRRLRPRLLRPRPRRRRHRRRHQRPRPLSHLRRPYHHRPHRPQVVDFTAEESDDGMSMGGRVTQLDGICSSAPARCSPRRNPPLQKPTRLLRATRLGP